MSSRMLLFVGCCAWLLAWSGGCDPAPANRPTPAGSGNSATQGSSTKEGSATTDGSSPTKNGSPAAADEAEGTGGKSPMGEPAPSQSEEGEDTGSGDVAEKRPTINDLKQHIDNSEDEPLPDAPPGTPDFVPPSDTLSQDELLVETEGLVRLHDDYNVWVDKANRRVVLLGEVVRREGILEMFTCLKGTKEHESILAVHTKAMLVHAALVALGIEPGEPVSFRPEYKPATGPEIEVTLIWKDEEGQQQTARAQDWIRYMKSKEALDAPFVFGGSNFWRYDEKDVEHYSAESGDFICVSNFTTAMIDLPIESSTQQNYELFEPFTEHIPPEKTLVTMVLSSKTNAKEPAEEAPAEAASPTEETVDNASDPSP